MHQLNQIHKCAEKTCYQYVNPYSIVVSREDELFFLDLQAKDSLPIQKFMKKREIREHFLPENMLYYQESSIELDIYGLGKTIQYILSMLNVSPKLTLSETKKCQKIISKCLNWNSKHSKKDLFSILNMIPKTKTQKEKHLKKYILLCAAVCLCVVSGRKIIKTEEFKSHSAAKADISFNETKELSEEIEKEPSDLQEEKAQLYIELGLVQFVELENYSKSCEYFELAGENESAKAMDTIAKSFIQDITDPENFKNKIDEIVQRMESCPDQQREKRILFLIKSFQFLLVNGGDLSDAEKLMLFCETYSADISEENQEKWLAGMAIAYEKMEKKEKAVEIYEKMLTYMKVKEEKENLFLKISELLIELDKRQEAKEILKKGLEECGNSSELCVSYIQVQLSDPSEKREECIQSINLLMHENPDIKEEEIFKQVLVENGMMIKGDVVCEKN